MPPSPEEFRGLDDEERRSGRDDAPAFEAKLSTEDFPAEETEEERALRAKKRRWFRIFLLASGMLVVFAATAIITMSFWRESGGEKVTKAPEEPSITLDDAREIRNLVLEARKTTDRFYAARTMEERAAFVCDPERVLPLMKEFYQRTEFGAFQPRKIGLEAAYLVERTTSDDVLAFTWAIMPDYSRAIFVCERTAGGEVRIDWESLVAHCSMSWESLRETRPTEPQVFRVVAGESDYYVSPYEDSEKHAVYRLADVSRTHFIHGYCKKGDEIDRRIDEQLRAGKDAYLTLEIRFPDNARSDNQVEIVALRSANWILGFGESPRFDPSRVLILKESD